MEGQHFFMENSNEQMYKEKETNVNDTVVTVAGKIHQ